MCIHKPITSIYINEAGYKEVIINGERLLLSEVSDYRKSEILEDLNKKLRDCFKNES